MIKFLNHNNCLRFKWQPKRDNFNTNEYNITNEMFTLLQNWKKNKNNKTKEAIKKEEQIIKTNQSKKMIQQVNEVQGKNKKEEFWKIIKRNTSVSQSTFHLKDEKGQIRFDIISNLKQLRNWYNNLTGEKRKIYHKEKYYNLTEKIEYKINLSSTNSTESIFDEPFTIQDLLPILSSLQNDKAHAFEIMDNVILKSFKMTTNNALLFKINCHRQLNTIPYNHWFSSKTSSPKIPNPNTPTKLRGITVLTAEASLTAKLDNKKFYKHLTANVPNNQMGFRFFIFSKKMQLSLG